MTTPVVDALSRAVEALGGQRRDGQIEMAEAVSGALRSGRHLLVQAGTGTGKSLGYLVPAFLHDSRVVVATATLALQHQLVERDIPRLISALPDGADHSFAVLKGRSNYACLHRVRAGIPDDNGTLSLEIAQSEMARKVLELREWAEEQAESKGEGDRDRAPRHTDREWRQVSVGHRECLGAAACPFGQECFAEIARDKASDSHVIVTNHSLLAIDAIQGVPMIPEYDAVVIDEAHELVARVTQSATAELGSADVQRAGRRANRYVEDHQGADLEDAADSLALAIAEIDPGRLDEVPEALADALTLARDAARACVSGFPKKSGEDADAGLTQAKGSVQEIFTVLERMAANAESDVLWLAEGGDRFPRRLHIAPLEVASQLRDKLLAETTAVFTSATLKLGGDFRSVAISLGLRPDDHESLDVGSPFDYPRQGIVYVAKHLPAPGRDGLGQAHLDEIVDLVDAADGRTLGLFSSRRAAEQAADYVRTRLPHLTTVAQGDAQLPDLARQFTEDPHTCLFGTLSLWQGLDVPGDTCQLVIIDRIPFPRPDDPLMSARQRAADRAGGNGFMQVAATHAALLLAQGAGRLIRTTADRGMVAVLDPRLATARYGSFLTDSLPPMWPTTDPAVARQALSRLAASAM
ncbi:ATP-dependent DNA helicase [soil metagenome]